MQRPIKRIVATFTKEKLEGATVIKGKLKYKIIRKTDNLTYICDVYKRK